MRSGFKKRESGCLVSAPEMRRLHMQFNRKAAFPILAGIRNTKPAAAKKGSRSGAACAAPAFSCPSCAALQCRRPACTGSRAAPAGFSSSTPGFTPKTAPRFLAWRVFARYAGGVRAARWCAGHSVPPKRGAQNAKRATDCGGMPQFFMERKAPFAAQRSLSDVAANIWKSAMTPNMHKTGTSVYTLRVPACFCAGSGGSTAQKRLDGRPSAAEHVAAFNCVRACAAKQSHYTRFSLSIPEKTAKFGKIRVVRMQKPFCAEKYPPVPGIPVQAGASVFRAFYAEAFCVPARVCAMRNTQFTCRVADLISLLEKSTETLPQRAEPPADKYAPRQWPFERLAPQLRGEQHRPLHVPSERSLASAFCAQRALFAI